MKNNNLNLSNDANVLDCVKSAYTDLQILLKDTFYNISHISGQLTFDDLYSLFIVYDWNDIFCKLEELENSSELEQYKSLVSFLTHSLKSDPSIKLLTNPKENTYYKVWAGLMTDEDF